MSEHESNAPRTPATQPARWNLHGCDTSGCRGWVLLRPNERCWNCHKLPGVPSDEPDVIGGERGDVTVIHVHLRTSLAEAERKLAEATWGHCVRHMEMWRDLSRYAANANTDDDPCVGCAYVDAIRQLGDAEQQAKDAAVDSKAQLDKSIDLAVEIATLTRQIETAREGLRKISAMQHDNLFHSIGMHCSACEAEALLAAIDAPAMCARLECGRRPHPVSEPCRDLPDASNEEEAGRRQCVQTINRFGFRLYRRVECERYPDWHIARPCNTNQETCLHHEPLYADAPPTDSDDELLLQEECVNCGDPQRRNLTSDSSKYSANGDALCPECGHDRVAYSQAIYDRTNPPPPADSNAETTAKESATAFAWLIRRGNAGGAS